MRRFEQSFKPLYKALISYKTVNTWDLQTFPKLSSPSDLASSLSIMLQEVPNLTRQFLGNMAYYNISFHEAHSKSVMFISLLTCKFKLFASSRGPHSLIDVVASHNALMQIHSSLVSQTCHP